MDTIQFWFSIWQLSVMFTMNQEWDELWIQQFLRKWSTQNEFHPRNNSCECKWMQCSWSSFYELHHQGESPKKLFRHTTPSHWPFKVLLWWWDADGGENGLLMCSTSLLEGLHGGVRGGLWPHHSHYRSRNSAVSLLYQCVTWMLIYTFMGRKTGHR